jgi:ArsR family transcriptional regulator
MSEIDRLLSMVENPTRRRILEALVREPHYPLQLSKELKISQQAIVKHLRALEECGVVSSYSEDSDRGPARKQYVPASEFTIMVDLRPGMFNAEIVSLRPAEENETEIRSDDLEKVRKEVGEIDSELDRIAQRREELLDRRARLLSVARELALDHGDYQIRRVMYEMLNRPLLGAEEIAKELSMRDDRIREILRELKG